MLARMERALQDSGLVLPEWWEGEGDLDDEYRAIAAALFAHEDALPEDAAWLVPLARQYALRVLNEWRERIAAHQKSVAGGQRGGMTEDTPTRRRIRERVRQKRAAGMMPRNILLDLLPNYGPHSKRKEKFSEAELEALVQNTVKSARKRKR